MTRLIAVAAIGVCLAGLGAWGWVRDGDVRDNADDYAAAYIRFAETRCVGPLLRGGEPKTDGLRVEFGGDGERSYYQDGSLLSENGTLSSGDRTLLILDTMDEIESQGGAGCMVSDIGALPIGVNSRTHVIYAEHTRERLTDWIDHEFAGDPTVFPSGCSPYDFGMEGQAIIGSGAAGLEQSDRTLQVRAMRVFRYTILFAHNFTTEEFCA